MKPIIIIPARFGSKRYKGKPLVKILGREMVLRVADICAKVSGQKNLYVATDNKKISKVVKNAGYKTIMTSKKCLTGTDRVAEAALKIKSKIFINVQGDEPTINPNDIKKIIQVKSKNKNHVVCGYGKLQKFDDPKNINLPKVVMNEKKELIYISRAVIPGSKRFNKNEIYYKQVCIYAFSRDELKMFYKKKRKSSLEKKEDIEILRFFDLNKKIKMVQLNSNSIAVDEMSDVKKAEKLLKKKYEKIYRYKFKKQI